MDTSEAYKEALRRFQAIKSRGASDKLAPDAKDADKIAWLLGRQNDADRMTRANRQREGARRALSDLNQAQSAMMRSRVNEAFRYTRDADAFTRGW